jgi:hypothetical protein
VLRSPAAQQRRPTRFGETKTPLWFPERELKPKVESNTYLRRRNSQSDRPPKPANASAPDSGNEIEVANGYPDKSGDGAGSFNWPSLDNLENLSQADFENDQARFQPKKTGDR